MSRSGPLRFWFRFHGTLKESVAAVFVAVPLSFAMNWFFIWIGVLVKKPETTVLAAVSILGTTTAYRRIDH